MRRVFLALAVVCASSSLARAECRQQCKEGEVLDVHGCCQPAPKHITLPPITDFKLVPKATATPTAKATAKAKATPFVAGVTVAHAEFSRDGMRVVSAEGNVARVRDAGTGTILLTLQHQSNVTDVTVSPDGKQIATMAYSTLHVWDARTGKQRFKVRTGGSRVSDLEYSPDGSAILSGSGSALDARTGKRLFALEGISEPIRDIAYSKYGQYVAAACGDKKARVWDAKTGKLHFTAPHEAAVVSVELSEGGSTLLTAGEEKVAKLWNVRTGELVESFKTHQGDRLTDAALSPDGRHMIVSSRDNSALLWSTKPRRNLGVVVHEGAAITDVEFSPDGSRVLTVGADERLCVWDASTQKRIVCVKHEEWVSRASFSPDGEWIVSVGGESAPRLIELPKK